MARSPLTETYKRVEGMVHYVQENLSSDEYMLFLDMVDPQPDLAPAKKTRKKRTTKSPRASGMAAAIKNSLEQGKQAATDDVPKSNGQLCIAKIPGLGVECCDPKDNRVHDKNAGYAGYHPFEPPAQTAEKKSRTKAAAASATQSLEIGVGAAGSASGERSSS